MKTVSIIIPTRNNYEVLKNCLENLWASIEGIDYELILFDNASNQQEVLNYYKTIEDKVTIIMSKENKNFAQANNIAASAATGKYLLFLNNDTIPQKNFLKEMIDCYERHPECGIVGAKLFFPNSNKIQHIGVILRPDSLPTHQCYIEENINNCKSLAETERKCVAITFACALTKTFIYKKLNGLDENYINGFEDTDFCFKLKEKNYSIWYCPKAFLYHIEHASGIINDLNFQNNVKAFYTKWVNKLSGVNVL